MSEHLTSCPRNCYSTCSMVVHVEDGRIRRIEPHKGNLATPEGVCLKGLSYVERQHTPQRILHPLRRVGRSREFRRISWEEAFDEITTRLSEFKDRYGPQSILYYAASGTKGLLNGVGLNFWRLFGGCTTTYGDLCWPAGLEATRLTLGENKHSVPWDLVHARLIVLWGKNPAETNIHQMVFIERAKGAGAKVVVIDPRRTQSCERADLLIQPRPGTDGLLALAVARLLIDAGKVNDEFIERYVHGFEEYVAMIREVDVLGAAQTCEVPISSVETLAEMLGDVRPATINCGYGMQRYSNSGQAMRSILALLAVTGNIGVPGAGWVYANLQSQIFGGERDPIAFYPPTKPDGIVRVSISTARLGPEILAAQDPPIKMIWVERGNPVTQNPETNTVLRAFRSVEFRVVIEQFLTDTAREADLILPSKTLFEQTDVINAYWHGYIQIKKKLLEPAGEVKPETVIYHELARRLSLEGRDREDLLPGGSDAQIEAYLEGRLASFPELSLERLKEGPILAPGQEEVAFSDRVFTTPSGRIELLSEEAKTRWGLDPLPRYNEPVESIRRESSESKPTKYSLALLTPNTKNRIHSQFNNLEMIRRFDPKPTVTLSVEDAKMRGIRAGEMVRVFNDRGELTVEARIDGSIKKGCVSIPNGWWISEGGGVNLLSKARETDMGYGAAFHENLVEVVRRD